MKNPHIKKRNTRKKKVSQKAGLPPGSMVFIGDKHEEAPELTIIDYDTSKFEVNTKATLQDALRRKETAPISWINIDQLHDVELMEKLGSHYEIHPLLMEDILNTDLRPKVEDEDEYVMLSLKMLQYEEQTDNLTTDQVSLILGKNYVISFREKPDNIFEPIINRLSSSKGSIRSRGADYLFYALTDVIVDNYFTIIENIGNQLEKLEERIFNHPGEDALQEIHRIKSDLLQLRKITYPIRESMRKLENDDIDLIEDKTRKYFTDIYEHIVQIIETIESYREVVSGLKDLYLSSISYRMNKVMQVLTIIATIFIPLTFLVGVYGMNFENMPELHWKYAYFVLWAIMISIVVLLTWYFRKKKWI
ncbi:magnesium/cobalt transporter CorA [Prolixibacter denitrificans]|uniref:Magnesium transport protein CorA n=1 Tax=Prolixibacter denitrificans TaxID=1541063 RepID=A0A2P8CEP0_9BACT|nr:magnesium/cobalt transporter CorA [Prolixibacter denitrificans]PSK83349.1 magnesium transporter [Prolixibacter denitrificans]GET21770.1 cobalt/magnesium transport protein CorA [Prolixibacter denitrificans]